MELNDASTYIQLLKAREGEPDRPNQYVGSSSNTGRVKLNQKKVFTGTSTDTKLGDWMGGPPTGAKKSYRIKAVRSKPREEVLSEPEPVEQQQDASDSEPALEPELDPVVDTAAVHVPEPTMVETEQSMVKSNEDELHPSESDPNDAAADNMNSPRETEPEPTESLSNSKGNFSFSQSVVVEKPDPSHFIQMRQVREGEPDRPNQYVGSSGNTGRIKLQKKLWSPTPTEENKRPDEWLSSPSSGKRRSWKVKSSTPKKAEEVKVTEAVPSAPDLDDSSEAINEGDEKKDFLTTEEYNVQSASTIPKSSEVDLVVQAPSLPEKTQDEDDDSEYEVASDNEVSPTIVKEDKAEEEGESKAASHPAKVQLNDAAEYVHLMRAREGETDRPDEYVGSSSNTGRVKLNTKKWTPRKPVESTRVDDWMGGPSKAKRSWKVKG